MFHSKVVVRAGAGMYYDRGELFSYLSPGYAIGTVTGGPFGVNQQLPFVNVSSCPTTRNLSTSTTSPPAAVTAALVLRRVRPRMQKATSRIPMAPRCSIAAPSNPKASDLANYLPNAYSIENYGDGAPGVINNGQPISLGVYNRANKLPYTFNYTLDIQWQPRNDLAIELGYVGNLGRHQVIPVPFNQPNIASPSSPTLGGGAYQQNYSYGYNVLRRHAARWQLAIKQTTKAATSTCAFPTSATRPSPSPMSLPASTPTTRSRRTLKSA